jgi:FHS family Na+ dependent glucose MFS transporter 1
MEGTSTAKSSISNRERRKEQLYKTVGYYAAYVALGLVAASLGPTLPGLAEHTGSNLGAIGFLFTARSLGYALGSFYGGRSYDRFTGHWVLSAALIVIAAMLALTPLASLLWLLTLIMLVMGLGEGTLDVGGNTLLVWLFRGDVGPFMNAMHFFFGAGAFLSPILIAQAIQRSGDITWAYWILALLVAPIAVWLVRVPSPGAPKTSSQDPSGQASPLLVFLVAAFFFLYVAAEASFGGWIFTYARSLKFSGGAFSVTTAAYLTSVFWGALTLGRLLSIPLAARLRPRTILFGGLLGCLISLGPILILPASDVVLWIGSFGLGLFMASIFPTTFAFAERRMPISGRITGLFFVGVGTGAMTVPWLVGQLFETLGPRALPYILSIDLLLGVAVLIALLFTSRGARNQL